MTNRNLPSLPAGRPLRAVALGHALTDVLFNVSDALVQSIGLPKAGMVLQDQAASEALLAQLRQAGHAYQAVAGGSAANTAAALARAGTASGFAGRIGADDLSRSFADDTAAASVQTMLEVADDGSLGGRCIVLVTPDGERTMATFLGAAADVKSVPPVEQAGIAYIEGYLWDRPDGKATLEATLKRARATDTLTAFTLSDAFCVDRHRDDFLRLLREGLIDLLFANEAELIALHRSTSFDAALRDLSSLPSVPIVTRGARGAVVACNGALHEVAALPVQPVDLTGAGDAFAAGFMHAYEKGPTDAAAEGCRFAAEVIMHRGGRLPRAA